jgi:HNH endonuclease
VVLTGVPNTRLLVERRMPEQDCTEQVEWKQIERFEGYRFGSDGRIQTRWGSARGGTHAAKHRTLTDNWFDVKAHVTRTGYRRVNILEGTKARRAQVHRLILEAFVGECPPGMECRHLDSNPLNNRLSNLAWGTPRENSLDQVRNGSHPTAKLTEDDVRSIRAEYVKRKNSAMLAKKHNLCISAIQRIVTRKTWKHVA